MANQAFRTPLSYISLFPETEFNNIGEAYSLYGPGAYFLNLIYVVTDASKIAPANAALSLLKRRPDIALLQLNAANTNETYPYLQGVINTLLNYLVPPAGNVYNNWITIPQQHAVWQSAAAGTNSFIPYNRPARSINTDLNALGVSFSELAYRFSSDGASSNVWVYTELGLTASDVALLCKPDTGLDKWIGADGKTPITPELVMMSTGLDEKQLLDLIYNGFAPGDTENLNKLFINYSTTGTPPLQFIPQSSKTDKAVFQNMSVERLQRIRVFLLLAAKTGWDFTVLNTVLFKTGINGFTTADVNKQLRPLMKFHFVARILHKQLQDVLPMRTMTNRNAYYDNRKQPGSKTPPTPQNKATQYELMNTLHLLAAIKPAVAKGIETNAYPNTISQLVHAADGLNINVSQLKSYLDIQNIATLDLDNLYSLCLLQTELTDAGSSLAEYIPVVIEAHFSAAKFAAFDQWYAQLSQTLQQVINTYTLDPGHMPEQLPELVFKQWVHELSVFWSVNEDITYKLFAGYVSESGRPNYSSINAIFTSAAGLSTTKNFLEAWLPYVLAASRLKVTPEIVFVYSGKLSLLNANNILPPAYQDDYLLQLLHFQEVYTQIIPEKRLPFLTVMELPALTVNIMAAKMPMVTSWSANEIQFLITQWNIDKNAVGWECLTVLHKLADCFRISTKTTLMISTLSSYLDAVMNTNFAQFASIAADFEAYLETITQQNPALKAAYNVQRQAFLEQDRDILVPIALWTLNTLYADINGWDHVSDYFLNDVSASGVLTIAPVREATDVVQSYLLRCRNGLENVATDRLQTITDAMWTWIGNFRIWEAEQKLQEYPQNYFQIDNRDDASAIFNNFKGRLQQLDINEGVAAEAIQYYIDEWLKLTDKTLVDSIYYKRPNDGKFIIAILAKSNVEDQRYYYLEAEHTNNGFANFTPWQDIGIRIPSAKASMVFAFNRYFIFWSELSTKTDIDPSSEKNLKYNLHSASIKYISQDTRGNWQQPQVWDSFPFYLVSEDPNSKLKNWLYTNKAQASMQQLLAADKPFWKKPVALSIDGSLYVFLSPLIPLGLAVDDGFNEGGIVVSDAFIDTCMQIKNGYRGGSPLWLSPRTMDINGIISDRVAPLKIKNSATEYLFPWAEDGSVSGLVSLPQYSVFDVLKTSVSDYYQASSLQGATDVLNTRPANLIAGTEDSKNNRPNNAANLQPWAIQDIQAIRGMQAAFVITDIGSFLISGTGGGTPLVFGIDSNNTIGIDNSFKTSNYKMEDINNLFPQFYDQYFRYHGLDSALNDTVQSTPLSTDSQYDYKTYQTAPIVALPLNTNATQALFTGAYSLYAKELFFYVPGLIAQQLRSNLWNEEAAKWYRYIFNPFTGSATQQHAWKFYPFFSSGYNTYLSEKKWITEQYILNILEWGDNAFRQETWESLSVATQLYFEATDLLGQAPDILDRNLAFSKQDRSANTIPAIKIADFFGWPTDEVLHGFWLRVEDRLYKLRNGLNIDGQAQLPSEYGSPLDPGRVKLALQNNGINPYDDSSLKTRNTVYRFRELLPVTESVIDMTVQLGNQLLNVLQQRDNEQLQLLQATHQLNMENFIVQNFQSQIDEAQAEAAAIQASLTQAQQQQTHYRNLALKGLLGAEVESLDENEKAMNLQVAAAALREGATIAHLVPTIFGFADGGFQPGSAIDSAAQMLSETSSVVQMRSSIMGTKASYARREEDWVFMDATTAYTIAQLTESLTAANKRMLMAQVALLQHELSVTQSREIQSYLSNKFTNTDLYSWMSGQLSGLYFKVYQLALGALHRLQTAYTYELDDQNNFIPSNSWDSLRKGLLAGETLKLAVSRMRDAYMNNNKRRQEAENILSLKQLDAAAFLQFQQSGTLNFKLFTTNFGKQADAIVRIHAVSVSIPAVISPYEVFNGTLKNNGVNEQITISRGIDDMGVFADGMYDGRYLPFEGLTIPANAQSGDAGNADWLLIIPDTNLSKRISDVVITIKYTTK